MSFIAILYFSGGNPMRLLAALILSFSFSAFAFVPVNPLVQVRADVVSAQIYNPHYEAILCEGFAFGRTYSGAVIQSRVADIIPAGGYRYAYVNTNAFLNPFVQGWAQVLCRFVGRYY
jgi:hypothetical protein